MEDLRYKLALGMLNNVGAVTAKKLLTHFGTAEQIFKTPNQNFLEIQDIGTVFVNQLNKNEALKLADEELNNMQKNNIKIVFYGDAEYPDKLTNCSDSPYYLFHKGEINTNTQKSISIVGTRYATSYGKDLCSKLIKDIVNMGFRPVIVSGLAYGIDICAHKAALDNGLETIAVLGTGVQKIYPESHTNIARQIEENGALVSEFHSKAKIVPGNFASRNRIIAGLTEATIVIESPAKGGSLITADIANSYNRDVMAFPARPSDTQSAGCNNLIKRNIAALIESADDLVKILNWDVEHISKSKQLNLFPKNLPPEQLMILEMLKSESKSIDELCNESKKSITDLSAILLNMEFADLVRSIPGNRYRLV